MASGSTPQRPATWRGLALLGLLPSAFLAAIALETLSACNRKETPSDPLVAKGQANYAAHCTACHNRNPAQEGTLGPAVTGSSLELLKARVIHGTYPAGYTPKRETQIMQRLPLTEEDVEAIHAFLKTP
jgi:mono/diheme cytochrome c family protein